MSDNKIKIPNDAVIALERGSKIEAIKLLRMADNLGLKEAKERIEQYIEENPDVKSRLASANAESAKSALSWILVIGALAVLAYFFLDGKL